MKLQHRYLAVALAVGCGLLMCGAGTSTRGPRVGAAGGKFQQGWPPGGPAVSGGCSAAPPNTLVSPNAFDSAPWIPNANGGPLVPVVTSGQADPNGGTSAFRIDYDAASGVAYSYMENQSALTASAVNSCSVWVKGITVGGIEDFCIYDGAASQCIDCVYMMEGWTLCRQENITATTGTLAFQFGALPSQHANVARVAQSILTYGAECNVGAYAVPYAATCDNGATVDAGPGPAQFSFATASGSGMGSACACAAVSGTKGEVVTFTRASSAYCTKHDEFNNLAIGDMVLCATDQPRIMPGGDGTGPLGLLTERLGKNGALYSEDLTHSPEWLITGSATVVQRTGVTTTPWSATTVTELTTPGNGFDNVRQLDALAGAGYHVASCYAISAHAGADTYQILAYNGGAGTLDYADCPTVDSAWTRCSTTSANSAPTIAFIYVGNWTSTNAVHVYVAGCQLEPVGAAGMVATSYMPTTGTVNTRAIEVASAPYTASGTTQSQSVTSLVRARPVAGNSVFTRLRTNATNRSGLSCNSSAGTAANFLTTGGNALSTGGQMTNNAWSFLAGLYNGAYAQTCLNGICGAHGNAVITLPTGAQTFWIGADETAAFQPGGVTRGVCVDPSASLCLTAL